MESLGLILMAAVSAIQWLFEGFVAAISDPRDWGGLIVALGGGWILGRSWPRTEPCRGAVVDEGDWDEDDWDEDDEDAAAWWVTFGG